MKRFCSILLVCLSLVYNVVAQDTLRVSQILSKSYLGKYTTTFQDTNRRYTWGSLFDAPQLFHANTSDAVNFGINNYSNWLRFVLKNDTQQEDFLLDLSYPEIDSVQLFIKQLGLVDSIALFENQSLAERKYHHANFIFELHIPPGSTALCLLKINSQKQIIVPLQVATETQLLSATSASDALSGLYLGIMLAMILYNLFVYFSVRDRHYLYYCHYIFWVALTQATLMGFAHMLGVLEHTWLFSRLLMFVAPMSGIATIIFVQSFLQIKYNLPKATQFLNLIIVGDALAIVLLFFAQETLAYNIINLTAGLGSLIVLFVAIRVFQKKYKPARFFLFGWTFFLGSVIIFVLKDVGVLPYSICTVRAVQIGSVIEAMLLSFALADKMNMLKKEKEISQLAALAAAQENERIIREQNVILEEKVQERTIKLKETNEDLHNTLEDLKQAQSQLVESEKMASLGQLTAGIAHEINNPINFVTSNVGPLKRDVGMLLDMIQFTESMAEEEQMSLADKKQKIDQYKEELDFDYLKIEINHLLNGIYEGSSRTAEIVKGLRIFSRVDENDLKRADINEGIDSTLIIVNNLLNSSIQVVKEYAQPIPFIECYPGKLNQVFLNIISNAIHAIRQQHGDSGKGMIVIRTKALVDKVLIEIEDNGTGMDEQTQRKIYEPFFTTKEVGEGTGLGMSIVYNTIKKHNGSIRLISAPGQGSKFIIELPIVFTIQTPAL
jgi:two-component system NtrC family sensor kinase